MAEAEPRRPCVELIRLEVAVSCGGDEIVLRRGYGDDALRIAARTVPELERIAPDLLAAQLLRERGAPYVVFAVAPPTWGADRDIVTTYAALPAAALGAWMATRAADGAAAADLTDSSPTGGPAPREAAPATTGTARALAARRAPKAVDETPSMEEILASIRRIISSD